MATGALTLRISDEYSFAAFWGQADLNEQNVPETVKTLPTWKSLRDRMEVLDVAEPAVYEYGVLSKYVHSIQSALGCDNFSLEIGGCATNRLKNRYPDVLPYDYNRVMGLAAEEYINASHIALGKRQYIAAQGPKRFSILYCESNFLNMIENQRIQTIVNLTMTKEAGREKCARYWRRGFIQRPVVVENRLADWWIKRDPEETILATEDTQRIVQRMFTITYDKEVNKDPRTIVQYHYENWPDHGAPSLTLLKKLLDLIKEVNDPSPILVHCSAGLGRTGTVISAMHILEMVEAKEVAEEGMRRAVFHSIKDLRLQRGGMVTSETQFETIVSLGEGVLKKYS